MMLIMSGGSVFIGCRELRYGPRASGGGKLTHPTVSHRASFHNRRIYRRLHFPAFSFSLFRHFVNRYQDLEGAKKLS